MVLSPLSGGLEPKAFFEVGIRKPTIMTGRKIPVTEDELHGYVDNEWPAERRDDVEAWLAAHREDAERVRAWRWRAEALHARYGAVADEPVPQRHNIEDL